MKIAVNVSAITNGDMDFSEFDALGEVRYFGELTRGELKELIKDCDALVVNKVEVDGELIAACPSLKYVGTFATGYNVIDISACRKRGITVCNVPDYSTNPVSQHVFALLLALYGKLREYSASVDNGDWVRSKTFTYFPWPTSELYGKKFGVVGYGNIGSKVAKIAEAFGAEPLVYTRTKPSDCPYRLVTFEEILEESDVLSLHCPLTAQTEKMINAKTISAMKTGAVLINTARGGLIDEEALACALRTGKLAGAGLDVVSVEPMLADNPLLGVGNCIITPHIGWVARETRQRLLHIAADNLKSFIEGRPKNVVS